MATFACMSDEERISKHIWPNLPFATQLRADSLVESGGRVQISSPLQNRCLHAGDGERTERRTATLTRDAL